MDNKTLNNTAIQKPEISNPSTKASANKIIMAFITIRNNPKVRIVTGNVNRIRMGFTIKFNKASTRATTTAVKYPATVTPGRNFAKKTTTTAVSKMRRIKIIWLDF